MIHNLLLSGGQIRGLSYIGVLKALEELDLISDVYNICGVSSGSIFALAYCLGFKSHELKSIVMKLKVEDIKEEYSENIFQLVYNYGLDSGGKFERLFKVILKKKTGDENCTFKKLKSMVKDKNLIVVGSNITDMRTEFFSAEKTPDMEIWLALRISISFPIIFNRVIYNNKIYCDGGLTDNFPIEIFSNDLPRTLGISINSKSTIPDIENFHSYVIRILYILASQKQQELCGKYSSNIICINLKSSISSINFEDSEKQYLISQGYSQFLDQFSNLSICKDCKNTLKKINYNWINKIVLSIIDKLYK